MFEQPGAQQKSFFPLCTGCAAVGKQTRLQSPPPLPNKIKARSIMECVKKREWSIFHITHQSRLIQWIFVILYHLQASKQSIRRDLRLKASRRE